MFVSESGSLLAFTLSFHRKSLLPKLLLDLAS